MLSEVKPRVYIDTSVLSYFTSKFSQNLKIAARQLVTRDWWQNCQNKFDLVASVLVVQEARQGNPEEVKARLDVLDTITTLELSEDALVLAENLVDEGAIPLPAFEDALHIAIATTASGVEYLVSWNFRHIVNATMRPRINAVCHRANYEPIIICTPEELMGDD